MKPSKNVRFQLCDINQHNINHHNIDQRDVDQHNVNQLNIDQHNVNQRNINQHNTNNNSNNNLLDDEVKDHPIFSVNIWCQDIQQQIQQDSTRKKIINPQTKKIMTRFGQRYWDFLKLLHCCLHGADLFENEKRQYNILCKNN